jgi:hypothetical protein
MQLTGPGLYRVRLYANGELVAHRGFSVQADVTGSGRAV